MQYFTYIMKKEDETVNNHNLFNMIIFQETNKVNTEFQILIYGAVLGFFFLGLLIVILVLYKTIEHNCSNRCEEGYCRKLVEHDFKYVMLLLFFIVVFICTLVLGNNDKVMEYISFAGTVSSLILSVLAIIMTMLSESKNEGTKANIDSILSETQKSVSKINEFTNNIEEISKELHEYRNDIQKINNIIYEISNKTEELKANFDLLKEFIDKNYNFSKNSDEIESLTTKAKENKDKDFNINEMKNQEK